MTVVGDQSAVKRQIIAPLEQSERYESDLSASGKELDIPGRYAGNL